MVVEEQMDKPIRNCVLKVGGCVFGGEDGRIEVDVLPNTGVRTRYTACDGQFILGIDGGDISSNVGNHVEYCTSKETAWQPVSFRWHRHACSNCRDSESHITGSRSPLTRCFERNGQLMNTGTELEDPAYETDYTIDGEKSHTCWGSDYIIGNFSDLKMYAMDAGDLSKGPLNNAEWMKLRLWTHDCWALCSVVGSCVDIDLPETTMSVSTLVQPLDAALTVSAPAGTKYPVLRTTLRIWMSSPTELGSDMKWHYTLNPEKGSGYGHKVGTSGRVRAFSIDLRSDSWNIGGINDIMVYNGGYEDLFMQYDLKGLQDLFRRNKVIICLNDPDAILSNPFNITSNGFTYSLLNKDGLTITGGPKKMTMEWDILTAQDFPDSQNTVKISASMSGSIISQGTYTGKKASNVAGATAVSLIQKDVLEYYDRIGVLADTENYYTGITNIKNNKHVAMNVNTRKGLSLTGYRFDGWKERASKKTYDAGAGYTTTSHRTQFDAVMPMVRYAITLDDNGGSGGSGTIYEWHSVGFYGDKSLKNKITGVKVPVREGYDFTGYFGTAPKAEIPADGSLSGIQNTKYSKDVTLKALWKEKSYNINYHSNYNTDGSEELTEKDTKKYFETKKVKGNTLIGKTLEKKEHHFLGWSTNKKATVPEYKAGDSFTTNADTNLYAVWEKDVLEADIGTDEADNPGCYHDPELDDAESGGFWYRDSVTVRATGSCNYAPIANMWLCDPMKTEDKVGNFVYQGPNGQDWHAREYQPVDMDGDGVTDEAVRLQSRVVASAMNGKGVEKPSEIKNFYIDTEPPFVDKYDFGRTYDAASDTYTIRVNIYDYQSGVAEAVLQENNPDGTWSDIKTIDLRIYSNSRSAEYTTKDYEQAKFTSLPVNRTDYSRKYRIACRDAVGHESYSKEFTLAPELKLKSSIRKINGTSAQAGEELELLQYGNMYTWADVNTEGYAEQLLYVVPKCIHMFEGSHVQLTDSSQLDPLPLEESVRNNYKDKFDRYNFYIISTVNDAEGKAADTFAMECDESKLELKKTYDIYVYALRGEDCKKNVLKIKYLHKLTAHRVIISQSWQKPTFNWDEDTWFGWMMKQMEEANKKKEDKK